jgi:hypothetical protein
LTLRRNRDETGRLEVHLRRVFIILVGLVLLAGLLNAFGQRPDTSVAAGSAGTLKVYAASKVRGGLFYEARFTIDALQDIGNATLVLNPGWAEGITINTIEPSPVEETSVDGKLSLSFGPVDAGKTFIVFIQLQVNPTNIGRRSQSVALYDGDTLITSVDRNVTVYP